MALTTSNKGISLIKKFEGCRLQAYKCPAGVWTIGYGHTAGVKAGQTINQAQAEIYLKKDLERFEDKVNKYNRKYNWQQNEFDALVSFAFNIGSIDQLTANGTRSKSVIANKILLYNKAGGKTLSGLISRRKAERELYLSAIQESQKQNFNKHVKTLQEAINAEGGKLQIDGLLGDKTKAAIKKILLKAGNLNTATGRYGVGSRGVIVQWLQMRINSVMENENYTIEPDGKYGHDTRKAVGAWQEVAGLKVDYLAGANTINSLL